MPLAVELLLVDHQPFVMRYRLYLDPVRIQVNSVEPLAAAVAPSSVALVVEIVPLVSSDSVEPLVVELFPVEPLAAAVEPLPVDVVVPSSVVLVPDVAAFVLTYFGMPLVAVVEPLPVAPLADR